MCLCVSRRAVSRKLTCSTGQGKCRISLQVILRVCHHSNVSLTPDSDGLQAMPLPGLPQGRTSCKKKSHMGISFFSGGDAAGAGGRWLAKTEGGGTCRDESRVLLEEKPEWRHWRGEEKPDNFKGTEWRGVDCQQ